MSKSLFILIFVLSPVILFSQSKTDTAAVLAKSKYTELNGHVKPDESFFSFMFNVSTVFYTAKDQRINNFLNKYGYAEPQNIPMGIKIEFAGIPLGGKMMYSFNAATIVSRQDIITADLSLGAYYRFIKTKEIWILAGLALGEHFDRVVLNGNLPPSFDSLAKKYNTTLSLHRTGFITEPAVKIFWFPFQTKKYQLGLYAGVCYDFDFNSRWRVGYYPDGGSTFKNLRKPTDVGTVHEFGWVFNTGLSVCF